MRLEAYTLRDRQNFRSLLIEAKQDGLTVEQVLDELGRSMPDVGNVATVSGGNCPECKDGRIVQLVINGVKTELCVARKRKAGCGKLKEGCGYSRMVT